MLRCAAQDTSDQSRAAMYREDAEHHDITFLQVGYKGMLITWHVFSAQSSKIVCFCTYCPVPGSRTAGVVRTFSDIDMGTCKWYSLDLLPLPQAMDKAVLNLHACDRRS